MEERTEVVAGSSVCPEAMGAAKEDVAEMAAVAALGMVGED